MVFLFPRSAPTRREGCGLSFTNKGYVIGTGGGPEAQKEAPDRIQKAEEITVCHIFSSDMCCGKGAGGGIPDDAASHSNGCQRVVVAL